MTTCPCPLKLGMMVFTSSAGVYAAQEGSCYEYDDVAGTRSVSGSGTSTSGSQRITRLLDAEYNTTNKGGCVVRLAGLYHITRGAHSFYLSKLRKSLSDNGGNENGNVDASGQTLLNLIHYDDAASLVIAALLRGSSGGIYVGADMHPISRQEMMQLTIRSGLNCKSEEVKPILAVSAEEERPMLDGLESFFSGPKSGVPLGKELNNVKTKTDLDWEPQYSSFETFMKQQEQQHVPI